MRGAGPENAEGRRRRAIKIRFTQTAKTATTKALEENLCSGRKKEETVGCAKRYIAEKARQQPTGYLCRQMVLDAAAHIRPPLQLEAFEGPTRTDSVPPNVSFLSQFYG